jgi:hypothetical protein
LGGPISRWDAIAPHTVNRVLAERIVFQGGFERSGTLRGFA